MSIINIIVMMRKNDYKQLNAMVWIHKYLFIMYALSVQRIGFFCPDFKQSAKIPALRRPTSIPVKTGAPSSLPAGRQGTSIGS